MPTDAEFHMEPSCVGVKKILVNGHGNMTKMTAMPIYGKTLKNLLLWNQKADDLESWFAASGARVVVFLFNDDPGLTLTYFTARSNLVPFAFVWERGKTMDFFRNYCSL